MNNEERAEFKTIEDIDNYLLKQKSRHQIKKSILEEFKKYNMPTSKGQSKYIETPQKMWDLFKAYKEQVNNNPLKQKDWVGKDANVVQREYTRALTMEGFECFVMDNSKITYPDLTNYFENKDGRYKDYLPICSRIKREIRSDQIDKGLAGLINPSITQRLNGLTDKKELDHKGLDLGKKYQAKYDN